MRFKVPQSIDMPDRIVGPLTMIQFVEAVLGGGLAYILFKSLPSPLNIFFGLIVALLTLAIVFIKINERPFLFYFLAFLKYIVEPKQRIWQKNEQDDFNVEIYKSSNNNKPQISHKTLDRQKLADLAQQLDNQSIEKINTKH